MQRLVAGLALFVFMAACSDSSSTAPRQVQPSGTALHISDPPPPPLSGSGAGFLLAFSEGDASINASSVLGAPPAPLCLQGHGFDLSYTFRYLINNTLNNEMAHIDIDPSTTPPTTATGQVTMHDKGLGKTDAKGRVQDGAFALDILDGDGTITQFSFHYDITGVLTNLSTGEKCNATGRIDGSLVAGGG